MDKTTELTAKERVSNELSELINKLDKLESFIQTVDFPKLPEEQRYLLHLQSHAMNMYGTILARRIDIWED